MQKILLVNLMRMGDILQTTPLIQALRKDYPGVEISMLLNEAFTGMGRRVDLDGIYPFPITEFRERIARGEDFFRLYAFLRDFMGDMGAGGAYDWVFNLTPSTSAASLSSLIPHVGHDGMWLEEDGSVQTIGPWTAYLVAMTSCRRTNPFHLVDIWLRAMQRRGPWELAMRLEPAEEERAREIMVLHGLDSEKEILVGMQVAASQKEKCWSEKEFIRLGELLHRNVGARVLLFGVPAEEEQCTRVAEKIPGSINLAGKTGLGELAAVLKYCKLLVTNDTGTQHVATAVGTPVAVISVGPVFFRETGPYGEGHWILQARLPCAPCNFSAACLNPLCKEKIRADYVYSLVLQLLRGERNVRAVQSPDVACFRSGFDEEGWLSFVPSHPQPEDMANRLYKSLWLTLLEGRALDIPALEEACLEAEVGSGWRRFEPMLRRAARAMLEIEQAGKTPPSEASHWDTLRSNLRKTEKEMRQLSREVTELAPFVHYLFLRREALSFQDPFRFLQDAVALYTFMADLAVRGILTHSKERKEAM